MQEITFIFARFFFQWENVGTRIFFKKILSPLENQMVGPCDVFTVTKQITEKA